MTLVKICGVSDPKHARLAAALGADFIGMVFAPSRRQVTIGQGKRIAEGLGKAEPAVRTGDVAEIEAALGQKRPLLVGVFADQAPDTINDIARECGLDLVQLSGSEPWEMNEHIERPILKCMKVRDGETADRLMTHYHGGAVLLLDPYVEGSYGGTGRTIDWQVASEIAVQTPTILAGGLTPTNVGEAVRSVHPWAVDVSSGVETDGAKDPNKIRSFIAAAKESHVGAA
ncbi:MAG: phosphoribosylanthranilate isomerase [Dehalococcoidia bacterium]